MTRRRFPLSADGQQIAAEAYIYAYAMLSTTRPCSTQTQDPSFGYIGGFNRYRHYSTVTTENTDITA
ncbi:MAG: hypothetical protein R2853_19205 [Thermomicrobiales bacterium]